MKSTTDALQDKKEEDEDPSQVLLLPAFQIDPEDALKTQQSEIDICKNSLTSWFTGPLQFWNSTDEYKRGFLFKLFWGPRLYSVNIKEAFLFQPLEVPDLPTFFSSTYTFLNGDM